MTSVITASIIRLKEGDASGGNGAAGRLWHINKDGTLKRNKSRSFSTSCVRPVMSHGHQNILLEFVCFQHDPASFRPGGVAPPLPGVGAREALRASADSQLSSRSVWHAGRWLHLSTGKSSKPSNWDEDWDWNSPSEINVLSQGRNLV